MEVVREGEIPSKPSLYWREMACSNCQERDGTDYHEFFVKSNQCNRCFVERALRSFKRQAEELGLIEAAVAPAKLAADELLDVAQALNELMNRVLPLAIRLNA